MKSKFKNPKKAFKKLIAVFMVLILVSCAAGGGLVFSAVLDRESLFSRDRANKNKAANASSAQYSKADATESAQFGLSAKDVYITSDDGLKLHGYLAENKKSNGKYAIIFHGYTSEGSHMKRYAKHFYKLGYSVLAPDARAHGTSEGRIRGMGWLERKDAVCWANMLVQKNKDCKIVLFGVSMGGATVMMASAQETLPKQVFAVVEDCGYTSVWDEFAFRLKSMAGLPPFPVLSLAGLITKWFGGYSFKEASAVKQVRNSKVPILFIHGEEDSFVPFSMLDELYCAAGCDKRKLVIPGAGHAKSSSTDPDTYWSTVEEFLNGCMPK